VAHGQAAVQVDLDEDVPAVAGEGLVHAVVDQLVDELVQAAGAEVADVHARPLPDVGGVAEDLDVIGTVMAVKGGGGPFVPPDGGLRFVHDTPLSNRPSQAGRRGTLASPSPGEARVPRLPFTPA